MRRIAIAVAVLVLAACAARLPLTRIEAASAARNWCVRDGKAWGDPAEITPPGAADAAGRTWWKVRFPATAGDKRTVLVDAESGWTTLER